MQGTRVLKKMPAGSNVGDEDVFAFNDKFANKQLKIKINSVQSRESVEEQKETAEKVFADRQYAVDAAIVRIMKSRKRMDHTTLMSELMAQVFYRPRSSPEP
jgi:cullin-4